MNHRSASVCGGPGRGVRGVVSGHRGAGRDIIVVSASGHEVVDPIAALLGADTVIATQVVITDGRYTGDFAFYAYGEAKALRIRQLARRARIRAG